MRNTKAGESKLELAPLFDNGWDLPGWDATQGLAILPSRPTAEGDWDLESTQLERIVQKRPLIRAMRFGDYLHDGVGATFLLQVVVSPCGVGMSALVGVSKQDKRLRAVTSTRHPDRALVLPTLAWEKFRASKQNHVTAVFIPCGDHGSDYEEDVDLTIDHEKIRAWESYISCTAPNGNGVSKLVSTKEL